MRYTILALLVLFAIVPAGCGAAQHPDPTSPWPVALVLTVAAARGVDHGIEEFISTDTRIDSATRATVEIALHITDTALDGVAVALAAYQRALNVSAQCALQIALDTAVTEALHLLDVLDAAGVAIPLEAPAFISTLGAFGDAFVGDACTAPSTPALTRVGAALARRHYAH